MSDDIVERANAAIQKAADEIERLRSARLTLEQALSAVMLERDVFKSAVGDRIRERDEARQALSTAREDGRREGIMLAAKCLDAGGRRFLTFAEAAAAIRSLSSPQPETAGSGEPMKPIGAALRERPLSSAEPAGSGWRLVPTQATAENGMKAALIGDVLIPERELHYVDGDNRRSVSWTAIKSLYKQFLASAPPHPGGTQPRET